MARAIFYSEPYCVSVAFDDYLQCCYSVLVPDRSIRHSPSTHRTSLTLTQHLSTLGSDVRLLTNVCQTSKTAFSNFKQRLALFPAFCVVVHDVFSLCWVEEQQHDKTAKTNKAETRLARFVCITRHSFIQTFIAIRCTNIACLDLKATTKDYERFRIV